MSSDPTREAVGKAAQSAAGDAAGEAGQTTAAARSYSFGDFRLNVQDRQLWRGSGRVDLNARYWDALLLMVREPGRLIEKDRFFDEVWSDVVVSDSALTQCIKELRRVLGDDAASPRYIQTVPRYGYRFIARVDSLHGDPLARQPSGITDADLPHPASEAKESAVPIWRTPILELGIGTLGGGVSGLLGGLLYGFGMAVPEAGVGTLSTLLVLLSLGLLVGLIGGFGISLGIAGGGLAARWAPSLRPAFRIVGAAMGGLVVGSMAKLLGVDAFNLLLGRAPAGVTGGPEGAVLGAALMAGAYLGGLRKADKGQIILGGGLGGAVAGVLIPLAGGRLLGGSLDLLTQSFADSRLRLDRFGFLFGEAEFGAISQAVLGGVEGFLFGSCLVGALVLLRRRLFD